MAYGAFRDYLGYLTTPDPMTTPELHTGTVHDPWAQIVVAWRESASRATVAGAVAASATRAGERLTVNVALANIGCDRALHARDRDVGR